MKSTLKTDWNRVHIRAVAIANAAIAGDDPKMDVECARMLRLLNALRKKHGNHPSIIATKADYVRRKSYRVSLLKNALKLAEKRGDRENIKLILKDLRSEGAKKPC
jgi:hypothetical protein